MSIGMNTDIGTDISIKNTDFHSRHFDSIQALRGITALFIVLEHIRFLNCGAFGVDIFFCISGFMIMYSTHSHTRYFLRKRLIRILPLYYFMTLGTFFLLVLFPGMFEQSKADPVFLLKSLLFLPFDIGGGVLQPLMRVGWTINCEVFFYILFLIALKINHKYRGFFCSILLSGTVAAASLLPSPPAFLAFYGSPVMLEFILGILGYYAAWGLYNRLPGCRESVCLSVSQDLWADLPDCSSPSRESIFSASAALSCGGCLPCSSYCAPSQQDCTCAEYLPPWCGWATSVFPCI